MKRKLLSIAIASLVAAPAAFADVSVYGKVNVTLQQFDDTYTGSGLSYTARNNWEMLSNASRFGFKGDTAISDDLKAIYKIEWEYDTTGDSGGTLKARNMYAGLQGSFGTLIAGNNDTPLKMAQGNVDQFNDLTYGDLKNVMVGDNRESNIVMYSAPAMGGFSATVAFMPGENDGCKNPVTPLSCSGKGHNNNGFADGISAAIGYTMKDVFTINVAADQNVQNTDIVRVASEIYLGPVMIGLMAQEAKVHDDYSTLGIPTAGLGKLDGITKHISSNNGAFDIASATGVSVWDKQSGALASVAWKISDLTLKAQYAKSTTKTNSVVDPLNQGEFDAELTAIGADYKLSKQTKVFAYYAMLQADPNNATTKLTIKNDEEKTFGVGMEINF